MLLIGAFTLSFDTMGSSFALMIVEGVLMIALIEVWVSNGIYVQSEEVEQREDVKTQSS
ncbi:hypothetical protein [Pontibacillus yanchengensis]|uniref:hypothetical protein n=1 Tax=Pontibacillus yanchengensis TaxID=462910 RepID=UPI000A69DAA8|nr:hypothetical protein [Pontibacillus yanchengensis]